jgi:tetratricopeptide (TPR) repeat protein
MKSLCIIPLILLCFNASAQQEPAENSVPEEIDKFIQLYQFNNALTLLNSIEDSLSLEVLKRKGTCYHLLGNYNDAIKAYEKIVEIDSMNNGALNALGQLYSKQKQFGGSIICYTKLIAMDSLNSYYYKQFGIVGLQAAIPGVAFQNFAKALALNPGDIESCAHLAEMLIKGEQPEIAEKYLKKTLAVSSSSTLTLLLAKAQMGGKKYNAAINTIDKFLIKGDTTLEYARIKGICLFQLKKYEEAIPWLDFLLDNDMHAEWIYYHMGISYQNLNKHAVAINYFNKAVKEGISDQLGDYYVQLAWSHEAINNFKSAVKYYKAAYEESKDNLLLYQLGRSYDVYFKDTAKAIEYYKKYLKSADTAKLTREYSRMRVNELEFYR